MTGYGYSIWLVPLQWRQIKREYNLDFIPHITLLTNINFVSSKILSKEIFTARNFQKGEVFSKVYDYDPMYSFGYSCDIEPFFTFHRPHMSIFYSSNKIAYLDTIMSMKMPPQDMQCKLYLADTRSLNPCQWRLIE